MNVPQPTDFGGRCLAGECIFGADLLMPSSSYFGLPKTASYLYGTWRDGEGNLMRALRGVDTAESTFRYVFAAAPGGQLERDARADDQLWSGAVTIRRAGDAVTFESDHAGADEEFRFHHEPRRCSWREGEFLDVSGALVGPGLQWFNAWPDGGCYSISAKYRTTGYCLGRPVEGFVGHEIHYFPPDLTWMDSPYGRGGREICWQQIANEYEDGSIIQATFAYGADGWGFAMLHDEDGRFFCTTEVACEATTRANGYPEAVTYRFLGQSWTWRLDPQGERARTIPGAPLGADGTCTRDGDDRAVRLSMGNSDWWTDGRANSIIRR